MSIGITHVGNMSYTSFGFWQDGIYAAAGIVPGSNLWERRNQEPLAWFRLGMDGTHTIPAATCGPLAERIRELVPRLTDERLAKYADSFIRGLTACAQHGEDMRFT